MTRKILIIDDSRLVLKLSERQLKDAGYEVETAIDMSEVTDRLFSAKFDLILMDINMPEADGDKLAQLLRDKYEVSTPIILISDIPENELIERAQKAGVVGFISKKWGLNRLVEEVEQFFDATDAFRVSKPVAVEFGGEEANDKRILLIDTNKLVRKTARGVLIESGFEVIDATDIETIKGKIQSTPPDLILIDVDLQGSDLEGDMLVDYLVKNLKFNQPIVFFSKTPVEELKFLAEQTGAAGYISKNWPLSELATEVKKFLGLIDEKPKGSAVKN